MYIYYTYISIYLYTSTSIYIYTSISIYLPIDLSISGLPRLPTSPLCSMRRGFCCSRARMSRFSSTALDTQLKG